MKYLLLFSVFLLTGCIHQTTNNIPPKENFPQMVQNFKLMNITPYNEQATDIGIAYNHISRPIALTVYRYPAAKVYSFGSPSNVINEAKKRIFQDGYTRNIKTILTHHLHSKLIKEEDYSIVQNGLTYQGKRALFTYEEIFAGMKKRLKSTLYLFMVNDRFYKYRITYPLQMHADKETEEFIQTFPIK